MVAGFANGRKLLSLLESVDSKEGVDKLVQERGRKDVSDPSLQEMRKSLGKGRHSDGMRLDEDVTPFSHDMGELGADIGDMRRLAGLTTSK
jgi:hypothetical protein